MGKNRYFTHKPAYRRQLNRTSQARESRRWNLRSIKGLKDPELITGPTPNYKGKTSKLAAVLLAFSLGSAAAIGALSKDAKNAGKGKHPLKKDFHIYKQSGSSSTPVGINYDDGDQEFPDIYGGNVVYENGSYIEKYNTLTEQKVVLGQGSLPKVSADYIIWRDQNHNLTVYNKNTHTNTTLDQKVLGFDIEGNYIAFESEGDSSNQIGVIYIPSNQLSWISEAMYKPKVIFSEPVIDGSNVAWINLDKYSYEIYSLTTGATIEIPMTLGRGSIPYQFDLSGSKLVTPWSNGLIVEDINSGVQTQIRFGDTPLSAYFIGSKIYYPLNGIENPGIYSYDTASGEFETIQKISSLGFRWMNVDNQNNKVVWAAKLDYTPDSDVHVLDLSGTIDSPINDFTANDIRIQETSQLSYDPNAPAKFVLDAMFGSERDLKFDYIKSDVVLFVKTGKQINSAYLYLKDENGDLDVHQMTPSGSNPGELVFGGHIEKSTESTMRIYGEEFLTELLTGGEPGSAVLKGTVIGSLKAVLENWDSVYIDKVWMDGQLVDIPDHELSSIVNDRNIWKSQTEEFSVASPVDLEVEKDGQVINNDNNVVYSGPNEHPEFVLVFNPSGKYKAVITGTGDGTYTFAHKKVDGLTVTYEDIKRDVPIKAGEVHINGAPESGLENSLSSNKWLLAIPVIGGLLLGGSLAGYGVAKHRRKKKGGAESLSFEDYISERGDLMSELSDIENRLYELESIENELSDLASMESRLRELEEMESYFKQF